MPTIIRLADMPNETSFAPLGVLGYCLTRTQFLAPVWAELELGMKTEVQLNRLHPHAEDVAAGLERLLDHFGDP